MPRRSSHLLVTGALLATSALTLTPAQATGSDAPDPNGPAAPVGRASDVPAPGLSRGEAAEFVPGQVLVRFEAGTSAAAKSAARGRAGAVASRRLPLRGVELLKVDGGVKAAVAALERRADVVYAEPNYLYRTTGLSNDPYLPDQWGLHNTGQLLFGEPGTAGTPDADIDAPEAWSTVTGSAAVTVAVVDTGVDLDHPELAGQLWTNPADPANGVDDDGNGLVDDVHGWDWVEGDNAPNDWEGHGTHVAGTIGAAGNDAVGVAGVAWDVSIMPLRVMGGYGGTNADIASAFAYAGAHGADVVNASLGGPGDSRAIEDAITGAPDTMFVVAAGNEGTNNSQPSTPVFPCNYPAANLVCVAASDNHDVMAPFSNYSTLSVDLAAPGVGIASTVPSAAAVRSETFDAGLAPAWETGGTRPWIIESDEFGPYASDGIGYYPVDNDSWLATTSPLDLGGRRDCSVGFGTKLMLRSGDYLAVEASANGTTWTELGRHTSSLISWSWREHSLAGFEGQQQVWLRFRLRSNAVDGADGVSLDDVLVQCSPLAYDGSEYAIADGTSMAAPHVAGAAALLRSFVPDASVARMRAALLGGVDVRPGLVSTATGGRLNVARSLDLMKGVVGFASSSLRVAENAGTASLMLTRTGDSSVPASVTVSRTGGTASASDIGVVGGTVGFAAGQTSAVVPVTILDDGVRESAETVVLSLSSADPTTTVGTATTTLTIVASDQRPDLTASTAKVSGYVGENVYNTTGRGQTKTLSRRRTGLATYFMRVQNDGNVTNTLRLTAGAPPRGTRVTYLMNGTDVTSSLLTAAGRPVRLAPGKRALVTVVVRVLRTATIGSVGTATVRATWTGDGTRVDVAKAVVKVVR